MAAVLQVFSKAMAQLQQGSLLRRSLVLTGVLVTAASVWVSVISIVLVSLVGRTFDAGAPRGSSAATNTTSASSGASKVAPSSEARRSSSSANGPTAPTKPNG